MYMLYHMNVGIQVYTETVCLVWAVLTCVCGTMPHTHSLPGRTASMYGYNKSCEVYMVRCDKATEEGGGRDVGGIGAREGVAMWGLLSRPLEEPGQRWLYKQTNRLGEREH